jgi:moderate conductance mechanosensitive channel
MYLFAMLIRSGLFAEGHFLGKILDEWIGDTQEFIHTKLPHMLVVLIIAVILSRIIIVGTNRMAAISEQKDTRPGRHSQIKTFASVLRATLNGILWTITALQILTVLGVNLGPLLASAGIAGVAIGLAAQTIVKDVLNGMLIILEDQFNVGDTVRLTGMTGTVEVMTLRRTEIRDGDGTLYVVPNSQITTVANLSRDFSIATVNVSVDFAAPPDKVIQLLTSVAMDVRNDKAFSDVFLKDPEVLGVDAIKGSEVIYPVVFKTIASKQYGAIREFRSRVRFALEKNGMLPGDPNRVFREFTATAAAQKQLTGGSTSDPTGDSETRIAREPREKPAIDPTTIKTQETNPFTGES